MTFRRATPGDAESMYRFWADAGASMHPTDDVEQVRRDVVNPAAVLLLAEAENEIVGTLLGTFDGWRGNMYRLVCIRAGVVRGSVASSCDRSRRCLRRGASVASRR